MAEGVTERSCENLQRIQSEYTRLLSSMRGHLLGRDEQIRRYIFVSPGKHGEAHPDDVKLPINMWDHFDD